MQQDRALASTQLLLMVLQLASQYGIPGIISLINEMNKKEVTLDDIKMLELKIKKPDEYFK